MSAAGGGGLRFVLVLDLYRRAIVPALGTTPAASRRLVSDALRP